jgi:23S rRNA (cytosine1962-C5)-methyltransferase
VNSTLPKVILKNAKFTDHPWVFGQHLNFAGTQEIRNGELADLVDSKQKWLARGHFNRHARVGFRILTRDHNVAIDEAWMGARLQEAFERRKLFIDPSKDSNAFRLIHSEGDGLSGLIIDLYHDVAVIEFFSKGMFMLRDVIIKELKMMIPNLKKIELFAEKRIQKQESFDLRRSDEHWETEIIEHDVKFIVRSDLNHKTGFYLDQREQRRYLQQISKGKKVMDLCSFAGGFALAAARGGAAAVYAVEMDPKAVELGQKNTLLNQAEVHWINDDLRNVVERDEYKKKMDIVILDPAKVTRDHRQIKKAMGVYRGLNASAMKALKPGGILLTCSCTGLIREDDFISAIRLAASDVGRCVSVFQTGGVSVDHPFSVNCSESRYLKVLWCMVS